MPNIVFEYSSNVSEAIDFTDLFSSIHQVMHELASIHLDIQRENHFKYPEGAFTIQ